MIYTSIGILTILLIIINIVNMGSGNYIDEATKGSQRIALNRLKKPHNNRSSELGSYPKLKKQKGVELLALKKNNRLYVINNHRVIYIVNAKINLDPTSTRINAARGERAFHVKNAKQSIAVNWLSFAKLGYIESIVSVNNHQVRGNWINDKYHLPNTIEVSKPDAKWLQQLPKDTELVIR